MNKLKDRVRYFIPPAIWSALASVKAAITNEKRGATIFHGHTPVQQELEVYWSEEMLQRLETWGQSNAWIELECFFQFREGKALDIACGTGVNILALDKFEGLDVYGIDISELLVQRALDKGVSKDRIFIGDVCETMPFEDAFFDFHYSIGSLEHFTLEGLRESLTSLRRSCKSTALGFHQVPVSIDNTDMGWITRYGQSYWNNSREFWMNIFQSHFENVQIIKSSWRDEGMSEGIWICTKG